MPVLTLIQDVFMAFKKPYDRYVGKFTINYCKRIARQKVPEGLRQTLVVSAVSADEVVAALLKLDTRRDVSAFIKLVPRQKPKAKCVKFAMKAYISAILVVFGNYKQQLLELAGETEQEFIALWLKVYSYDNDDMLFFNDLLQEYQKNGLQGISQILIEVMKGCIWEQPFIVQSEQLHFFADNITEDVGSIVAQIEKLTPAKNIFK